ncbi:hypothetical protein NKG05_01240 [Oerskovia sp. M15]
MLAPEAGVVTFAGTVVDRGVVVVLHDGGLRTSRARHRRRDARDAGRSRGRRGDAPGRRGLVGGPACRALSPGLVPALGPPARRDLRGPLAMLGAREPIVLLPLG